MTFLLWVGISTLVVSLTIWLFMFITRGWKAARVPICTVKGHLWHEGEDTYHNLMGTPGGGFSYGTFIWRCHRCGAETGEGEPPPPNSSWDYSWVSPEDDPHAWGDREGDCFRAYRHIRDNVGELVPPGQEETTT